MQTLESQRLNLVCNIGTSITDVAIHLAQYTDVFVAVEEGVFVFAMHSGAACAPMGGFVRLEARIGQDDDQSL
jgi:hypothetical protein